MTPTTSSPTAVARPSAEEVVASTWKLVPRLRERIFATEELRRLPPETVQDGHDAGIFTLLLPRSLGGSAGSLDDAVQVMRALAQGDPTAAWTLGFLMSHNYLLARFPEAAQKDFFTDGRPAQMAGVANPPGRAEPVDGGYLVTGYWGYCSGVMHSDWVMVTAIIDGEPFPSVFLLPRAEADVQDTWFMSGMKGTGSHDVKLEQVFVPAHRVENFLQQCSRNSSGASLHPEPLYAYDGRDLIQLIGPSIVLGTAEAVLEGYRDRLEKRRAAFSPTVTGDTVAGQIRYARAVSALRAAQAVLDSVVRTTTDANAQSGEDLDFELRAQLKLDCLSVIRLAQEAVRTAVAGSGSSIFRSGDVTQHYLRDLQTILGHLTIDEDGMQARAGEILLGRSTEPDPTLIFT
ncbi:acyl-CoA dehydrogenase [Kitasatospora sp. NE20-6]|uniref:acyl-CoA dehydrogenase family protein n=1 Tax=Kitasatospora sp. NE20-6 TaxID=2859066 RepID=UPI0034DCB650